VPPAVNQIELSPFHFAKELVEWCQNQGVVVEAYSPLTRGKRLHDPVLQSAASAHGKTTAQVLIRWCLQHQFVAIPKSARRERIEENAQVFDFSLSDEEMRTLDNLGGAQPDRPSRRVSPCKSPGPRLVTVKVGLYGPSHAGTQTLRARGSIDARSLRRAFRTPPSSW
jgi:diketogulonate reductase-like aldo/keto reductase